MSTSAAGIPPSLAWRPVLGPADRETFFAAQVRNRRATWRLAALCALAVVLMSIPLSATISPLVYAVALIVYDLVSLVWHLPDALQWLSHGGPVATEAASLPLWAARVGMVAGLVLPGLLTMGFVWVGVRALFFRYGAGSVLRRLGARDPRLGDLEEQQLANVVQEMAIAGGVPAPRVMLIDAPVANAAAIGFDPAHCTILVSRRLLDELPRDETQAVIAHLIGSVGNGDLRIAMLILSMFQTFAVVMAVLGAPFGAEARQTLWRLARFAVRRRGTPDTDAEADDINELLSRNLDMHNPNVARHAEQVKDRTRLRDIITLPVYMAYAAFWLCRSIIVMLIVGPLISLTWRTRRYLADATAVQLTRDPDAVARALMQLSAKGNVVPGGRWAAHLFIVGADTRAARTAGDPAGSTDGQGLMGGGSAVAVSFNPPTDKRVRRLQAQGARVELVASPRRMPPALVGCFAIVFVPLAVLLLGCAVAITGVSLAIDGLFLAPVVGLLHFLIYGVIGKHL